MVILLNFVNSDMNLSGRWPLSLTAYGATIALFAMLLVIGLSQTPAVASAPAESFSNSEKSGLSAAGIYALTLWIVIPAAIFLVAQFQSVRRFNALREARGKIGHLQEVIEGAPLDYVPTVEAKAAVQK